MKTKSQNTKATPGLRVRSSNHQAEQTSVSTAKTPALLPINFDRRRENRALPVERVIELLKKEAPGFFNLAEVVGQWIWIQFREKQPRNVTAVLAELGFHWNNKRQAWQHPCGTIAPMVPRDPREKYPSYFPADVKAA